MIFVLICNYFFASTAAAEEGCTGWVIEMNGTVIILVKSNAVFNVTVQKL